MTSDPQATRPHFLFGRFKTPRHPRFAHILFFAPTPLLLGVLFGPADVKIASLVMLGILGLPIWLLRNGLRAAQAYETAEIAIRPKWPLKLIALAALAGGVWIMTLRASRGSLTEASVATAAAVVLYLVAFGLDPLRSKGLDAPGAGDRMRAAKAVAQARKALDGIGLKLGLLADPELDAGFVRFETAAGHLFEAIEGDPARHRSLRKHLGVFIDAAGEATDKFSVIYRGTRDAEAKARYLGMLEDLAQQFDARAQRYLLDGKGALDVEIDVLSARLHDTAA